MDKKKIVLSIIVIILFIVVFFLAYLLFYKYVLKRNFENDILSFANKNEETVFQINEILYFSSCDAKNKNISNTNFTIENLYQYTDIALFINSPLEEKTAQNTLKSLTLNNIQFVESPSVGEPSLNYKNIQNFSKSDLLEDSVIGDSFEFTITSEDEADLNQPILYNNLANPIVFSYINSNIKTDYTLTDTSSPITYDGSLLKKCSVLLNPLKCKISFDIYITNNLDEKFKCTVYLDIPLEKNEQTIYDGKVSTTEQVNYTFYRYQ